MSDSLINVKNGKGGKMKIYSNIDREKIDEDQYILSGWAAVSSDEMVELLINIRGL